MAKYERGVMRGVLRFELTLQTLDVTTHSYAGNNDEDLKRLMDRVREYAQQQLNDHVAWKASQQEALAAKEEKVYKAQESGH